MHWSVNKLGKVGLLINLLCLFLAPVTAVRDPVDLDRLQDRWRGEREGDVEAEGLGQLPCDLQPTGEQSQNTCGWLCSAAGRRAEVLLLYLPSRKSTCSALLCSPAGVQRKRRSLEFRAPVCI